MVKKLFNWIFSKQLLELEHELSKVKSSLNSCEMLQKQLMSVLKNFDISVDVHEYPHEHSTSWAVLSLQGQSTNYIKFVDLSNKDIQEIANFLRRFEKDYQIKVDATPYLKKLIRC